MPRKHTVKFRVRADELSALRELSRRTGTSVSALVRAFLPPVSLLAGVLSLSDGEIMTIDCSREFHG